mmetsp:Transcript_20886/g.52146  ORF Transcript_20886/g.52146 Transcript_20886/m.52146 type:complete len:93 (+) Transcript_20886:1834-2112(+)
MKNIRDLALYRWAAMHLEGNNNGKIGRYKRAFSDCANNFSKAFASTERVPMSHDGLVLLIPAINFNLPTSLQQLPTVGISGADAGELVANNV